VIDPATITAVERHGFTHKMGLCICPCFDALVAVAKAIATERDLMAKVGSVSPEALAVLVGANPALRDEA